MAWIVENERAGPVVFCFPDSRTYTLPPRGTLNLDGLPYSREVLEKCKSVIEALSLGLVTQKRKDLVAAPISQQPPPVQPSPMPQLDNSKVLLDRLDRMEVIIRTMAESKVTPGLDISGLVERIVSAIGSRSTGSAGATALGSGPMSEAEIALQMRRVEEVSASLDNGKREMVVKESTLKAVDADVDELERLISGMQQKKGN
jgi:hypothetical protein